MTQAHTRIQDYAVKHPDFWFVQIGAFDGVTGDPIHRFITRFGWKGVLVEPQKDAFDLLKENYKNVTGLEFENVAIAEKDGTKSFYGVAPASYDDFNHGQLHSFRDDVILKHTHMVEGLRERLITYKVKCMTLASLLAKHGIGRLDLLQIDTEGYDFEVIKQIDFARTRPAMIHFEHKHLSPEDKRECYKLLTGHGYKLTQGRFNTLAY